MENNDKCYKKYDINHNNYELETHEYLKNNINIFQFYLFSDNEYEHAKILYDIINPKNYSKILDMGCGVGEIGKIFKSINPTIDFTGITNSEIQYQISSQKIKTIFGDYHTIPLPDNSVDIVLFLESFGHGDPVVLFMEIRRILKKGGILFLKDFFSHGQTIYNNLWDYTFMGVYHFKNMALSFNFEIIKEIQLSDDVKYKKKYSDFVNNSSLMKKLHNILPANQPTCPMCFYLVKK